MRLARLFALFAATLAPAAGCGATPEVPRADASGAAEYAAPAFRDDAAANAAVADGGSPQSFTDAEGVAVDLKQYRGAKLGPRAVS